MAKRKITPVPIKNKIQSDTGEATQAYIDFLEEIRKQLLYFYDQIEDIKARLEALETP